MLEEYDTIVIGSGNGACGFLSEYVRAANKSSPERIVVIEEGDNFFNTSDITHQGNWTRSYAEGDIFKLHTASTFDGIPIISGRACTMGGGGSINYTMIHESSEWLTTHIGKTIAYWDDLKAELNKKFEREDPAKITSPIASHILQQAREFGFTDSTNKTCNIPNYQEGNEKLLHQFPTQFDQFGQRTHSGVSLVDWSLAYLHLKTQSKAIQLEFVNDVKGKARCASVSIEHLNTGKITNLSLSKHGKLILCAGAATPRLLYPHRERLQNYAIGQQVSDHILIPLGVYTVPKDINISPRDVYVPVFATTVSTTEGQALPTVCCFDFFAGDFEKLWFFIAHLYLAFLLPNWLKKWVIRTPWLFFIIKNVVRIFIQIVNTIVNIWQGFSNLRQLKSWRHEELNLVTAIVKFNPSIEGYYQADDCKIALGLFASDDRLLFNRDKEIAKQVISEQIEFVNRLGQQPHPVFKWVFRLLTKIPYEQSQIENYIDTYSQHFLLSEQHLSGGCLFGKAIDTGAIIETDTGKLNGSANVYVADLSSVPLPRISPQMTAYLIGFHVAKMLRNHD
jgi:hypothetical protein